MTKKKLPESEKAVPGQMSHVKIREMLENGKPKRKGESEANSILTGLLLKAMADRDHLRASILKRMIEDSVDEIDQL